MATSIPTAEQVKSMDPAGYKVYENRVRRAAERQDLRLEKSRRRDPRAVAYGTYQLVDPHSDSVVASAGPSGFGLQLTSIHQHLRPGVVRVDYSQPFEEPAFQFDEDRTPILQWRDGDGWVLYTADADQYIIGKHLTADEAVKEAERHLEADLE